MQTTVPPVPPVPHRDASCADVAASVRSRPAALFPPRDADGETFRAWIASSPWPEVVFAAAGSR